MSEKKEQSILQRWKQKKSTLPSKTADGNAVEVAPLTPGQQRIWYLQQLFSDNPFYHYADLYRFNGPFDSSRFRAAFKNVFDRHHILKTRIRLKEGIPEQFVDHELTFGFTEHDLTSASSEDAEQILNERSVVEARLPFSMEDGPLVRLSIFKLGVDDHAALISMHHIVTDKWSMKVLREELAAFYSGRTEPEPLSTQFLDYANTPVTEDDKKARFWTETLTGSDADPGLPLDFTPPVSPTFDGAYVSRGIPENWVPTIETACSTLGITKYVFLLSVFNLLVAKLSGREDITVGAPLTNRHSADLENLIGFFNDTVVLRGRPEDPKPFSEFAMEMSGVVTDAISNADVQFENIVNALNPERSINHNPLFRLMFIFHQVPESPDFGELKVDYEPLDLGVTKFDLTLYISEDKGQFDAIFEYSKDIFRESTIELFHDYFLGLLRQVLDDSRKTVDAYELELDQTALHAFENGDPLEKNPRNVVELIEEQFAANKSAIAVSAGGRQLTYEELDRKSARVAGFLKARNNGRIPVALCFEPSVEQIVAIVGVIRSGAPYLPLDPGAPTERRNKLIEACGVNIGLSGMEIDAKIEFADIAKLPDNSFENILIEEDSFVYIITTSGSTGEPKHVAISHRNLAHSNRARIEYYGANPKSFLRFSPYYFDSSIVGTFWPLTTGGRVVLPERRLEQDVESLGAMIKNEGVTHTLLLPSLYESLIVADLDFSQLSSLIVAGEGVSIGAVSKHFETFPETRLFNEYGPTEATVWTSVHEFSTNDRSVSIGRPIPGYVVRIVDRAGNRVPIGVPGELVVEGPGVAKYLGEPAAPVYKTGDQCKWNDDGTIEFCGRRDQQVKIRGHRVETAEISFVVKSLPGIDNAVTTVATDERGQRLITFFESTSTFPETEIAEEVGRLLPSYMIPDKFISIERIPYLPNGKVDLKALPIPDRQQDAKVAPVSDAEVILTKIWSEVLEIETVGVTEDYFEIGGDSIKSIRIISKAKSQGIELEPNHIFEFPTIRELAHASTFKTRKNTEIYSGKATLTPIQRWFFNTVATDQKHWNLGIVVSTPQEIDATRLKKAIETTVLRNDALRSRFETDENGERVIRIGKSPRFTFLETIESDPTFTGRLQASFDLESGPLLAAGFSRSDSRLFLIGHHLIIDPLSWEQIVSDIASAYDSSEGAIPDSYGEWSNEYGDAIAKADFQNDIAYWQSEVAGLEPFRGTEDNALRTETVIDTVISERLKQLGPDEPYTAEEVLFSAWALSLESESDVVIGIERQLRNVSSKFPAPIGIAGWFTYVFPVRIVTQNASLPDTIARFRENMLKGIGFDQLRYSGELGTTDDPQYLFNFLGEGSGFGTGFEFVRSLDEGLRGNRTERSASLEVNLEFVDNALAVRITRDVEQFAEKDLDAIIERFGAHLRRFLDEIEATNFDHADLSETDLDTLLGQL